MNSDMPDGAGAPPVSGRLTQAPLRRRTPCGVAPPRGPRGLRSDGATSCPRHVTHDVRRARGLRSDGATSCPRHVTHDVRRARGLRSNGATSCPRHATDDVHRARGLRSDGATSCPRHATHDGVMPQTREHLAICSLLHVKSGLVVLTKTDLVERDWLELVKDEVAALVRGTFLEGTPLLAVSSKTGEGLLELRAALRSLAETVAARGLGQLPRLPVARVFTVRGFGTVG